MPQKFISCDQRFILLCNGCCHFNYPFTFKNTSLKFSRVEIFSYFFFFSVYYLAPRKCNKLADIVFIMDSSDRVGNENYQKQKDFVKVIAGSFGIQPGGSRAGVILYSDQATSNIRLNDYLYEEDFAREVDRLPYMKGETRIGKALELAATQLMVPIDGIRPGLVKIIMLLTAGGQLNRNDTILLDAAMQMLKHMAAKVIVIGVGEEVDKSEMRSLVAHRKNVLLEKSFDSLLLKTRQIAKLACDNAGWLLPEV